MEDEPGYSGGGRTCPKAVGGFQVCVCSSGEEAIRAAPEFSPQLILLDVMMPGMDGPGTLQTLRKLHRSAQPPVIFITAKVQPAEVVHYRALGAMDVIAKPFDPMLLSQTINEIWQRGHD